MVGVKEEERELAQTLVQHLVALIALDYGTNLKIVIIIIVQVNLHIIYNLFLVYPFIQIYMSKSF